MATLLNNTTTQQQTTSNQGTNVTPKLNASSFFFLDTSSFVQLFNSAFGVINNNEFRCTASFNVESRKVITVCAGQIFIQPNIQSNTKVNVILKPYKQPINGLSIKYFIYRGLPKSEFFEGNNIKQNGSDFINFIRTEFESFYQEVLEEEAPIFSAGFIGFPDSSFPQDETDLIDDYFFKTSSDDDESMGFELPIVPAGIHLATTTGTIGLDIVLNDGDYYYENSDFQFDLKFARENVLILSTSEVVGEYAKKNRKELSTKFIDPAAYYGLHANDGGKVFMYGQNVPLTSYEAISNLISSFITKNNIYIYIQSNRQKSYNFYDNYQLENTDINNIRIGNAATSLISEPYTDNGWPIKIYSTPPAANSIMQNVHLQLVTDRNPNVVAYSTFGNITSYNEEKFVDGKYLLPEIVENPNAKSFTNSLEFLSPAHNNQNISSLIQIVYFGVNLILSRPGEDDNNPDTPPAQPIKFPFKYKDDIFGLIDAIALFKREDNLTVHSYLPTIVNLYFANLKIKRRNTIANIHKSKDTVTINSESILLVNYILSSYASQSNYSLTSDNISPNKETGGYSAQGSQVTKNISGFTPNEYLDILKFTDDGSNKNGLIIKNTDGSLPSTMLLGIIESENNIVENLSEFANNPKIYFYPFFEDTNTFTSPEGVEYQKFIIKVASDKDDFSQELLAMENLEDSIIVYTIDGLIFFSDAYGNAIASKLSNENRILIDPTDSN